MQSFGIFFLLDLDFLHFRNSIHGTSILQIIKLVVAYFGAKGVNQHLRVTPLYYVFLLFLYYFTHLKGH